MNCNWPIVKLGDYCSKIGSGATPKGGNSVYLDHGEISLIRSQNIYNEGFKSDGLVYITPEAAQKLKNVIIEPNDVLINITGDSVARVCLAPNEFLPARVNQHVAILRVDPEEFDHRYLRYFLTSTKMQNYLLTIASTGGTRNALTKSMLESLEVSKPSLDVQKRIGDALESFESKIELNSRTNQTLEEMAQAIFKSWFVDFDPVKAKMNGEQPEGMDEATASLFPEKLVESELGLIPEGWEIKPIKDLCSKVQNGGTPKRSESSYWDDGDIPWLTSGEVRQSIITSVENRITQLGLDKSSAKWVPELSTLVALYGATAGEVSLTSIPLTTNQAVCALMPKKEHQWYNYLQLKSRVAELAGKAVGSAQQNISKGLVESTEVLSVPESLLEAFNAQVENLFKLRICNLQENVELANLRNTLLPKLLSGEIELETK
ncbi:TPA: restriction endonuclease subunit S [Vibrio vulnificus]|nr:restriction endonuclease subunit S [Vibrio vulnificus]